MQEIEVIEALSKTIIEKLHTKFKNTSCSKTAKGYFDSAKIVKAESEKFAKKIKSKS